MRFFFKLEDVISPFLCSHAIVVEIDQQCWAVPPRGIITAAHWPYVDTRVVSRPWVYLVNTMVGWTARLVSVAVKDHDLDDHVTKGE